MSTTIFRNVRIGYNDKGDLLTFQVPILGMARIPAGANPRNAKQNKAVKAMEAGMIGDDPLFTDRNRGITTIAREWQVIYNPDGTTDIEVDYTNPGKGTSVGHFDGGHTELACHLHNQGAASTTCSVEIKVFNLGRYSTQLQVRSVAQASNFISGQKAWSEADLRGAFDGIKSTWGKLFPNASVEYYENQFNNPNYRVLEILKLMFSLLGAGEANALYDGKGRPPTHNPIAHDINAAALCASYERSSSFFNSLDLETWSWFADFIRDDIDKKGSTLRIAEKLPSGKRQNTLSNSRLIQKTRSSKLTPALFDGTILSDNFMDMMWVFPIIHAFKQKFYRYRPSSREMVWFDCEGFPLMSPTKASIRKELKSAWRQLRKPIIQTMCDEFNSKWGGANARVNGFFPKCPEMWKAVASVVTGFALKPSTGVRKGVTSVASQPMQGAII